jgi:hypothetical protein
MDVEVLRGDALSEFLSYTLISDIGNLAPIIHRMLASAIDKVTERGAEWAILTYLHTRNMRAEVTLCISGSIPHRLGLAAILARELATDRCDVSAIGWSLTLLNDSDENVRRTMASTFLQPEFYKRPDARATLINFTGSNAFAANVDNVLHGLKETTVPLIGFADAIHAIVARLGELATTSADGMSTYYLPNVLLRLYEQAESDPATRQRCLDILDKALQDRLGYDMTKAVDD